MPLIKQVVGYESICSECNGVIDAGDHGVVDTKQRVIYCLECAEDVEDKTGMEVEK